VIGNYDGLAAFAVKRIRTLYRAAEDNRTTSTLLSRIRCQAERRISAVRNHEGKYYMSQLKRLTAAALPAVLIAGMAMSLAACNTVSGAGKDVSAGGSAVTTGADKVKDKL
jgi:entericidin B